jgi:hypothetical protein
VYEPSPVVWFAVVFAGRTSAAGVTPEAHVAAATGTPPGGTHVALAEHAALATVANPVGGGGGGAVQADVVTDRFTAPDVDPSTTMRIANLYDEPHASPPIVTDVCVTPVTFAPVGAVTASAAETNMSMPRTRTSRSRIRC